MDEKKQTAQSPTEAKEKFLLKTNKDDTNTGSHLPCEYCRRNNTMKAASTRQRRRDAKMLIFFSE